MVQVVSRFRVRGVRRGSLVIHIEVSKFKDEKRLKSEALIYKYI